jgi:hypothetical protein
VEHVEGYFSASDGTFFVGAMKYLLKLRGKETSSIARFGQSESGMIGIVLKESINL